MSLRTGKVATSVLNRKPQRIIFGKSGCGSEKKRYLCNARFFGTTLRFVPELRGNAVRIGGSNRCCMSLPMRAGADPDPYAEKRFKMMPLVLLLPGRP